MVTGRLTGSDTNKMRPSVAPPLTCGPVRAEVTHTRGSRASLYSKGACPLQFDPDREAQLSVRSADSLVSFQYLDVAFHSLL